MIGKYYITAEALRIRRIHLPAAAGILIRKKIGNSLFQNLLSIVRTIFSYCVSQIRQNRNCRAFFQRRISNQGSSMRSQFLLFHICIIRKQCKAAVFILDFCQILHHHITVFCCFI